MEPKYNFNNIYSEIKSEITSGVYPLGVLLPTEQNLANKYSVSRPTIAKVYNQLQDEGFIKKKIGFGTVVVYMQNKQTNTFGLLLPGAGESEIFSIINDQILNQSKSGKFDCLWEGATASNAEMRKMFIEKCCDNYIKAQVDGIFFSPLERVPDADRLNAIICEKITDANIPIVLIDRDIVEFPNRSSYDLVGLDNFNAGYVMAQHLIHASCELIYFFSRPNSANSLGLRLSGVWTAVQKHNLSFTSEKIICADAGDIELLKQIKVLPGKTGIVCANDSTAAVLMSSLDAIGLKITSDLLISGFDDMKYAEHLKYSLTSYKQPCKEIADASIELMFRRVKEKESIPITVNMIGEVIERDSSQFI